MVDINWSNCIGKMLINLTEPNQLKSWLVSFFSPMHSAENVFVLTLVLLFNTFV